MEKILSIRVLRSVMCFLPFYLFTLLPLSAQNFPVGIVSVQDSVKSVQFGVISSIATEGGHGVQFGGVSNTSASVFNGLQLGGISNITQGMDRGLQLSGFLNVSSEMMRGWQFGAVNYADSLSYDGEWEFWQYSETGKVDGIGCYVDLDVYHTTLESFESLLIHK